MTYLVTLMLLFLAVSQHSYAAIISRTPQKLTDDTKLIHQAVSKAGQFPDQKNVPDNWMIIVNQSDVKAVKWPNRAAELGDIDRPSRNTDKNGPGVAQSGEVALEEFTKEPEHRDMNGENGPQNMREKEDIHEPDEDAPKELDHEPEHENDDDSNNHGNMNEKEDIHRPDEDAPKEHEDAPKEHDHEPGHEKDDDHNNRGRMEESGGGVLHPDEADKEHTSEPEHEDVDAHNKPENMNEKEGNDHHPDEEPPKEHANEPEHGHEDDQHNHGHMEENEGVHHPDNGDKEHAEEPEHGNQEGQGNNGHMSESGGDLPRPGDEDPMKWLRRSADPPNNGRPVKLVAMYFDGRNGLQFHQAMNWLHKASEH